jgi:hypothetical protein
MKNYHTIKTSAIIFVFVSCLFSPGIQAQHMEKTYSDLQLKENQYYSKKHKKQKRTAWILLTGGTALTIGGIVGEVASFTGFTFTQPEKSNETGSYVALAGLASMATSIPFFIASAKNKKRANIALIQEKITMGHKVNQQSNYNSIALSIRLGK